MIISAPAIQPVYSFSHQWYYDLTIGVRLEVIWVLEPFSNDSVVVDFAIDGKGNAVVAVGERLSARVNTNNRETLVGKHYEESELPHHGNYFLRIPVLLAK
jgi:hypothetical protein